MRWRPLLSFLVVLCLSLGAAPAAKKLETSRQFQINVMVQQGDPLGELREGGNIDILNRSQLRVLEEQTAYLTVGISNFRKSDGQRLPELLIQVQVKPDSEGRLQLDLKSEHTYLSSQTAQGEKHVFQSASHTRQVELGKPFKVRLSADSATNQTWFEGTIEAVKP